jgi:hypothetical protein
LSPQFAKKPQSLLGIGSVAKLPAKVEEQIHLMPGDGTGGREQMINDSERTLGLACANGATVGARCHR